ncbi:MAG TPA: SURF1 family protein [Wenzhouxiangella sp.]|nr:SURF1 family protein [Wenzhouxiangella sp.]
MKKPLSLIFSGLPHIAAIAVIVVCFMLAGWQFDRADEKRALLRHWDNAPAAGLEQAEDHFSPYAKIHARGRFDARQQILLDNQVRNGQAGVHVFTPFVPAGQSRIWLVNRGWHALPSRHSSLPHIDAPQGDVEIFGRLTKPPRAGLQLGEIPPLDTRQWPNLMTWLDMDVVARALGRNLAAHVVLLDPDHPAHLTGDAWQPITFTPERHLAYAWQWITMAVVVFLIWAGLSWKRFAKK